MTAQTQGKIEIVEQLCKLIEDHKGESVLALDISSSSIFVDYFIIVTVTSAAHLKGLLKNIKMFLLEKGIDPFHRQKRLEIDRWVLLDCGEIVVHLMDEETRDFYDLERLYFNAQKIYSSKSSSKSSS